ncbi:MAG: hypothetical protein M3323_05290 [Actinomycetota bacterium]|nr:hypothetical protein [Actinomycetota bacterium]
MRSYEREGLFAPPGRTSSGYRQLVFRDGGFHWLAVGPAGQPDRRTAVGL